jgi:hypothetical protein
MKKFFEKFLQSFIVLPMITSAIIPPNAVPAAPAKTALEQKQNPAVKTQIKSDDKVDLSHLQPEIAAAIKQKGRVIDAYYRENKMRLAGFGLKMAYEAYKNKLDWRLLPAISVRESTGGNHKCRKVSYSHFGYGGCKIGFDSTNQEIEIVARNLGGKNPKTAQYYNIAYLKDVLENYNGRAVENYADDVMAIMDDINATTLKA